MWSAAIRSVGFGCARVLTGRETACVILGRTQGPWRITKFAACLHGKDSAIGSLLGMSQEQPAEEYITQQAPAVPFNKADQDQLLTNTPDQPENPKLLKIAIIGAPNAGKSTLSNHLLGRKLFPVSSKVHTTRCLAQGVITEGNIQLDIRDSLQLWKNHNNLSQGKILLDTPGMVNAIKLKRHKLEKSLRDDPWESMKLADVVLVLVDVSEKWMRSSLHFEVLKCLSQNPTVTSILVLNKDVFDVHFLEFLMKSLQEVTIIQHFWQDQQVDLLRDKSYLLEITETLTKGVVKGKKARVQSLIKSSQKKMKPEDAALMKKDEAQQNSNEQPKRSIRSPDPLTKDSSTQMVGWAHFQEVFMLSAINRDEVKTLKKYLMTLANPGEWIFHSDVVTTQSPQEICDNVIREKLLEYLPLEIPYSITQVTNLWEEGSSGELVIMQTLLVSKENHVKIVIGAGGSLINRVASEAGRDLMNAFLCDVRLRLSVKFKK